MKSALILHGAGNDSSGNWFPWLKEELEKRGYKVWVPDLPNSDVPVLKDWLETIFSNKDWKFDNDSIMIGHSSGATLILRILEELPQGIQINKAILVAAPIDKGSKPEYFQYKEDLTRQRFNWDKIKMSVKQFYFIASDNDPYDCGIRHAEEMQSHLGGEIIFKLDQGHFNLEVGPQYKKIPLVFDLI